MNKYLIAFAVAILCSVAYAEKEESDLRQPKKPSLAHFPLIQPIEVRWDLLIDIEYQLKYFKELDMEVYAPIFSQAAKRIDGKEVILEGYVIPFDESGELLSLSANPYASCFFCGNASPASVVSMRLKNEDKRYKMDDYKRFRGILHLNYEDPNEFYYILEEAVEE